MVHLGTGIIYDVLIGLGIVYEIWVRPPSRSYNGLLALAGIYLLGFALGLVNYLYTSR